MIGYDIDGVLTKQKLPDDCDVVISGRTLAEYDQTCRNLACRVPVYIRGSGNYGNREAAGRFKSMMINHLGVKVFYEDDPVQIKIIQEKTNCEVRKV